MIYPNVALQSKIDVILLQQELPAAQRVVKCEERALIPSTGRLQPNLEAARGPVRPGQFKLARTQYGAVTIEAEAVRVSQPLHLILGRMERPEPHDQNAAQGQRSKNTYRLLGHVSPPRLHKPAIA